LNKVTNMGIKLLNLLLGLILVSVTASETHASLSAVNWDRALAGKDPAALAGDLNVVETVAEVWSPEWHHEITKAQAVSLAQRALEKIDQLQATAARESVGELELLKGLTAHYAYNLEVKEDYQVAVESLEKARTMLSADCRPLWFLGNHYAQAGDTEKGVPLLVQAARQCGENLPVAFWEQYAYAAVLAAMPATGSYALDQVKRRNGGKLTTKVKAVEDGVQRRLVPAKPGKGYQSDEVWHLEKSEAKVRLINCMYGMMIDLPGDWQIAPFDVRNGKSGIGVRLPKKGKWPPPLEVVVLISPAQESKQEKVLRTFLAQAGPKRSYSPLHGLGVPAVDRFFWLESKGKPGSRVVAGILRRQQPAYPGLLFESPHQVPEPEGDAQLPHYFTPLQQLTRLPVGLDYIIMIEGAPAAFDKNHGDLELLLSNLVIE
jgi:hypothetical protein